MKSIYLFVSLLVLCYSAMAVSYSETSYTDVSAADLSYVNTSSSSDIISAVDISSTIDFNMINDYVLKSGPMVYVAANPALVIDSSTREIVSTIKSPQNGTTIDAIAASPDGKYIYLAISWAEYESDYYGGHYNKHSRIIRLNATTQDPIDYYQFDTIYPWHLEVSPDGKVYLGFQTYGYPNSAGIKIMDFSTGEWWYIDFDQAMTINDFTFSPDGSQVYYSAWWDSSTIYELDWTTNKGYAYYLPGNFSDYYQYARSIALGIDGKMLYSVLNRNYGIFAMNTQDNGKHMISTTYIPVALTVSSDEQTLYVIGYILDSNGDPLYMIHKYGGLKVVGPYFDAIEDYTLSAGSTFYTTDAMNYLTKPSDFYPSRIVVSSDGKYAYILTASTDSISGGSSGGPILVYDLEYMNQLPNIDAEDTKFDISAASEKIVFAPTPDYDWLGQFAIDPLPVFDTTVIYPKKFYPQNGSYADYLAEYFIIDVAFTEYLDNSTVTNETFWVTDDDDNIVPGHAGAASAMAFFSPYSLLENNTDYVAHLSKNITSKTGKPLYSDVEWSFTTKNNSDPTSSSSTTIDLSLIEPLIPVPLGTFVIVPPSDSSETNQSTNQTEPNPTNSTTINQTAEESTPVETTQTAEQIEPQQSEETQTSSETISENAPEAMITPIETTNSSANGAGVGNQSGNPDEQEGIGDLSHVGEETQLNPQPEPPTPLASVVEFFKWLFGVKYVMP